MRYGGGCAQHDFVLVASRAFITSHPIQAATLLSQNGKADLCKALITEVRRFDLSPLRTVYRQAYGAPSGTLVLNLQSFRILYQF